MTSSPGFRDRLLRTCLLLFPGALLLGGCANTVRSGEEPGIKTIRVSHTSVIDVDDLPALLVERALARKGYRVTRTYYAQSELAVQALSRGDADFGYGATRTHWAAIAKGAPIRSLMEQASSAWVVLAPVALDDCADLHGRRLGQHSEGSVGRALMDGYLRMRCPSVRPQVVTIPGSQNRAAALLGGLVDAAVVDLADCAAINRQAPGRFRSLIDFGRELPNLNTTGLHVNLEYFRKNRAVVRDYVRATLLVHQQIAEDSSAVKRLAQERLRLEPGLASEIIDAYQTNMIWKTDGGFTEESIRATLDFFIQSGSLAPTLEAAQVADLTVLREALNEKRNTGSALRTPPGEASDEF